MSEVGFQKPQSHSSLHPGRLQNSRVVHWILNKLQQSQMSGSKNTEVGIPRNRGGEKNNRYLQQESRYAVYAGQRKEQGQEAKAGLESCEREAGRECGVAESLVLVTYREVSAASREG